MLEICDKHLPHPLLPPKKKDGLVDQQRNGKMEKIGDRADFKNLLIIKPLSNWTELNHKT